MGKRSVIWIVLFLCVMVIATPLVAQSGDDVPAGYRKLRDLHIFTDDRKGQWAGSGNGMVLEVIGEGSQAVLPIDETETFNDWISPRIGMEMILSEAFSSFSETPSSSEPMIIALGRLKSTR